MSSIKLFPLVTLLFLVVVIFTGLNEVGKEAVIHNPNLDTKSNTIITTLNTRIDTDFSGITDTTNLSANLSNNEGQDAFALQFLESKQQKTGLKEITNSIANTPDLILLSFNDDIQESDLNIYTVFLTAFIVIILFVAGFTAIFGDGRFT